MCPAFQDNSDSQQNAWNAIWLPRYIQRLSKLIVGNLTLLDSEWNNFPYICGFESQITGRLSPFCNTFTQEELEQYEYQQDLRYYYGVGPAANVSSKMMVPFLSSLIERLLDGPGAEGVNEDGGTFSVPNLLMSFVNDGQLSQLAVATGIFDQQTPLPVAHIPENRLWRSSRITPMRGTIALERLNCVAHDGNQPSATVTSKRCEARHSSGVSSRMTRSSSEARNETFVRIRLNDAVYPLASCQDGPGRSCLLANYAKYVGNKIKTDGSFAKLCNATAPGTPTEAIGASFFTNLALPNLQIVKP